MISFEDFKKVNIRMGKVLSAEKIEGADKLLKLRMDLGSEDRQIVSGISQHYNPSDLVGRILPVVVNLEPREIMGERSEGMILAAVTDGKPVLFSPDEDVPPGSSVS